MGSFIEKYVAKSRGPGKSDVRHDDCIAVHKFTSGGKSTVQLNFRIGIEVMRQARWISGDKAVIAIGEVDGKPAFSLRRSPEGYTLSSGTKKKGECVTCTLRCSPDGEMQKFATQFVGNRYLPTIEGNSLVVTVDDKL